MKSTVWLSELTLFVVLASSMAHHLRVIQAANTAILMFTQDVTNGRHDAQLQSFGK